MVIISACKYGVKIILKCQWESGFLRGVAWNPPPLCTNGRSEYLMQLSVKLLQLGKEAIAPILCKLLNLCLIKNGYFSDENLIVSFLFIQVVSKKNLLTTDLYKFNLFVLNY